MKLQDIISKWRLCFLRKRYIIYIVCLLYGSRRRAYIGKIILLFVGCIGGWREVVGVGCLCLFCSCIFSQKKYNDVVNDEASKTKLVVVFNNYRWWAVSLLSIQAVAVVWIYSLLSQAYLFCIVYSNDYKKHKSCS